MKLDPSKCYSCDWVQVEYLCTEFDIFSCGHPSKKEHSDITMCRCPLDVDLGQGDKMEQDKNKPKRRYKLQEIEKELGMNEEQAKLYVGLLYAH